MATSERSINTIGFDSAPDRQKATPTADMTALADANARADMTALVDANATLTATTLADANATLTATTLTATTLADATATLTADRRFRREDDEEIERKLRPSRFDEYIGQEKVKHNMRVFIEAAKGRNETLDHVLLYGQPGLGKTTLSNIIASEMDARLRITAGPAIERPGDMAAILNDLNEGDFLFIDEIHRLNRAIEEILYPAMEDFVLDIVIGKGPAAKSIRLDLPKFTLIGATTRIGLLTAPLRDRFGVVHHLEPYTVGELVAILTRSAQVLDVALTPGGAEEIARRSRGTPRITNRLLKRVRDFAQVQYDGIITDDVAKASLDRLEIDPVGLDMVDKKILRAIIDKFGGGPVGLDTLAASIDEEAGTLEDVSEPYLLQLGFIQRTPRGRTVTRLGYAHLGLTAPDTAEGQLSLL